MAKRKKKKRAVKKRNSKESSKNFFWEYLKKSKASFISFFRKIDKRVIYIALFDLLFFAILMTGLFVWNNKVMEKTNEISPDLLENPANLSPENAAETAALIKGFVVSVIACTLLLLVFLLIVWSFSRGIIWNMVFKKGFTFKYYRKFLLLNLLWFAAWLIPVVLIIASLKRKPSAMVLLIIFVLFCYLTALIYIIFTKNNLIWESIKEVFKLGFGKIQFFILPCIFLILTMAVISLILWPTHFFPQKAYLVISTVSMVLYLAWARFYIADVVKSIK